MGKIPKNSYIQISQKSDFSSKSEESHSLFLVISYDKKLEMLYDAVKEVFNGRFDVVSGKDCCPRILDGICQKIKEVDFGIVVLSGIKKVAKKKSESVFKMNIPFELGMLYVLEKPILYLYTDDSFNIDREFSDIRDVQLGQKISLPKTKKALLKLIRNNFNAFIPQLIEATAIKWHQESIQNNPKISVSDSKKMLANLRIVARSFFVKLA